MTQVDSAEKAIMYYDVFAVYTSIYYIMIKISGYFLKNIKQWL